MLTNLNHIFFETWSPNGCSSAPQMHSSIFSCPHEIQLDIKTADVVSNVDFQLWQAGKKMLFCYFITLAAGWLLIYELGIWHYRCWIGWTLLCALVHSMWRSYWLCNAFQHWSLSVPISTSNIAKRSISAIFIRWDYFAAHRSTMAGDNRQTVVLKEKHTVGVVLGYLSRNTGDKHGTWKTLFCLLYHINFLPFLQDQKTKPGL